MLGAYVLSHGYYDAYYRKALLVRDAINQEFRELFEEVDEDLRLNTREYLLKRIKNLV